MPFSNNTVLPSLPPGILNDAITFNFNIKPGGKGQSQKFNTATNSKSKHGYCGGSISNLFHKDKNEGNVVRRRSLRLLNTSRFYSKSSGFVISSSFLISATSLVVTATLPQKFLVTQFGLFGLYPSALGKLAEIRNEQRA